MYRVVKLGGHLVYVLQAIMHVCLLCRRVGNMFFVLLFFLQKECFHVRQTDNAFKRVEGLTSLDIKQIDFSFKSLFPLGNAPQIMR